VDDSQQLLKGEAVKTLLASVSSVNEAKQEETSCLDNSWKVWLVGCLSHLIILHMVVPFDS